MSCNSYYQLPPVSVTPRVTGDRFADLEARLKQQHKHELQQLRGKYERELASQRRDYEEELAFKDDEIRRLKFKLFFDAILKNSSEETSDVPKDGSTSPTNRSESPTMSTQPFIDEIVDLSEESGFRDAVHVNYTPCGPMGGRYQRRPRPSGQDEHSQQGQYNFRGTPSSRSHTSFGSGNVTGNYMVNVGNSVTVYQNVGGNGTAADPKVTDLLRRDF